MKKLHLFLTLILLTAFIVTSCKNTGQNAISTLFTGGTWRLASVEVVKYVGNTQVSDTTVNDTCGQYFTFNKDLTCTYSNFNCVPQPEAAGTWSLTTNQLFLLADIVCKDTSGTAKPFINAQIVNLGQYSMVLNTGDIQPNYSLTQPRTIVQYGFIRQKFVDTAAAKIGAVRFK